MPNKIASDTLGSSLDKEETLSENSLAKRQKELRLEREAERNANRSIKIEKWKSHPFWLFRISYLILHSIWLVAMAIGGFIAWLISFLFI